MKVSQVIFMIALIFLCQSVYPQQNGTLFLSSETLKKYAYSYEVDQYSSEHKYPERFSNSGWKYHPGDDARWKDVAYNDSDWNISQTDFQLDSIPKSMWKGMGWFRLKLIIDSSLYNQVVALVMTHYGASEIYLDGKLINQFGTPDKNTAIEKKLRPLFAQPVMLSLDNRPEHLLAVRYSFTQAWALHNKYGILWHIDGQYSFAGFTVHFGNSKDAIDLYYESFAKNLFVAIICLSILLLMGSFHFFLFWFHSPDRSNLYIGLFIFILAGQCFAKFLPSYANLGLETMILANVLRTLFGSFWLPAMMLAYYSVFYNKPPKHVWLYFIWTPIWIYIQFFYLSGTLVIGYLFVCLFDLIRLDVISK